MYVKCKSSESNAAKSFTLKENMENLRFMKVTEGVFDIKLDVSSTVSKDLRVFDLDKRYYNPFGS